MKFEELLTGTIAKSKNASEVLVVSAGDGAIPRRITYQPKQLGGDHNERRVLLNILLNAYI